MKYGSESCLLVYKWDSTPFYYKIVVVESGSLGECSINNLIKWQQIEMHRF